MEYADNYLNIRETGAFREQRAFIKIREYLATLEPHLKIKENEALKKLRAIAKYERIASCLEFRLENGTHDLKRCLYPLSYLASGFLACTEAAIAARERSQLIADAARESGRVFELEKYRADRLSQQAEESFLREYPTLELQDAAILRVWEKFRADYAGMGPENPIFRKIAILSVFSGIRALERRSKTAQDELTTIE